MPWLQALAAQASSAADEANREETRQRVEETYGEIADKVPFSEFLGRVIGRDLTGDETAYVDLIPDALTEGIRASVSNALKRGVPVYAQWAPAYDYNVSLWEAKAGDTSGGLILQVSGPYPARPTSA
jgi:hypothetical protein